ncbi:hypothetical protein ACQWTT_001220 [Acinetobacter baumannii]
MMVLLEKLKEMDREELQEKLMAKISKGRFYIFMGIAMPAMYVVSHILFLSFFKDPAFLKDVEVNQYIIDFVFFVGNHSFFFGSFAFLYLIITVYRGYWTIRVAKEQLLLIDIVKKKEIADLTGKDYDFSKELEKHNLSKYLTYGEVQKELPPQELKIKGELEGRSLPFIYTGEALETLFVFISSNLLASMGLEALYHTSDNTVLTWLLFSGLLLIMIFIAYKTVWFTYFAFKGLPVPIEEDKVQKFPPARLKFRSIFSSFLFLVVNVLIIVVGIRMYLKGLLDTTSFIQLSFAILALLIGLLSQVLLLREHFAWKASHEKLTDK